jgi:hypothetical protein
MTTKRLSLALAAAVATALLAAAPSFASPSKGKQSNTKADKTTYYVVTLETVYVSN